MSETDPLREEHNQLRRDALRTRRAFLRSPEGTFARKMQDAMEEYHRMRAAGVSREDACKGLEMVLHDSWPKLATKFPPCQDCDGTGRRVVACWHEQRCERESCRIQHPSWEHAYVVPCDCVKGDVFRPRVYTPEDELTKVGRVAKPKRGGWSRVGH